MRAVLALCISLALTLPVQGQAVLSEVRGNWAGSSGQGFSFLARLTQNADRVRLTIWGGAPGSDTVASLNPEFDNPDFALSAFATRQALEVVDTGNGSILQVVVEFADEEAEGRSVTQVQLIDNQFTVVGFYHQSIFDKPGGTLETFECEVDLWNLVATENGTSRQLEPVGFEAMNGSAWTWDAAFDRGFCSRG